MSTLGAVLAGGQSRRFGSDKARAALGGETLLERAVATLRAGLPDADLVIVSSSAAAEVAGARRIADRRHGRGPLAGIEAALLHGRAEGHDAVFVLACDLPLVTADIVRALAQGRGSGVALAPERAGPPGFEPLCASYRSDCADEATRILDEGRNAAHELLTAVGGRTLSVSGGAPFTNVNTPEDLGLVRGALAAQRGGGRPTRRRADTGRPGSGKGRRA